MTAADDVSRETSERLRIYADLLRRWNTRINLVAPGTLGVLETRHIADSLQVCEHLPPSGSIVDLGSGAGFPGLVVGLATGRPVTLIEADARKAAFLREAARVTATAATVLVCRIEDCGLSGADVVLARALAPLRLLLRLAVPLLAADGVCLFLKGENVARELTDAEREWQMSVSHHPSRIMPQGCVLEVRHPRRVGQSG